MFLLVVFFVGPIFKIIIASSVLNENYSVKDGFYSFICFIGLLFVTKPSVLFHQQMTVEDVPRSIAIVAVLVGALMSAMAYVTARKLGQDTHIVVHMVYFGLVASIISLPRLQEFVIPDQLDTIWMLGAIGLVAFLGQTLLNHG
jgi:drug/metabolite transporter (DMT)-like permease